MAKKEVKTDLWVAAQLDECKIHFDAQGSNVKEINEALKTASKRGTGNAGYPEYTAVIGDFVLVIEDKADMDKQIKLTDSGIIDMSVKAVDRLCRERRVFLREAYCAEHGVQEGVRGRRFWRCEASRHHALVGG